MNIKPFILSIILCMTAGIHTCHAQDDAYKSYPDFEHCFNILQKNRLIYNQYNDSILLLTDRNRWINFFHRRSIKNHQLHDTNKEVINTILQYFKQDKKNIPAAAYEALYQGLYTQQDSKSNDPFLTEEFCNILEDYYQDCPDSLNHLPVVNLWKGYSYYEIWSMGKDTTMLDKSYEYFKKDLYLPNHNLPEYNAGKFLSLGNLILTVWLVKKKQTISEFNDCVRMTAEMLKHPEQLKDVSSTAIKENKLYLQTCDERLLRNIYLADSSVLDKRVADSLTARVVARNKTLKNLTDLSYHRMLLMQVQLKQITFDKALELALQRYRSSRKILHKTRFTDKQLQNFLQPFITIFYLNDMASIPVSQKRRTVKWLCRDIVTAYKRRIDQQYSSSYVRNLNTLTTYPRISRYLTSEERIRFLNTLTVTTHVTTYAHSAHTALLAERLMDGIIKYRPGLLAGTFGLNTEEEIRKHRKLYRKFIHDAALYHDLGKNFIIPVVNNDYRPITDHEYQIIKTHPELGLHFLAIDSTLAKFHDTTLGHHKWYNGRGGYPESFDNTASPLRIMIDIITLCDCMQAATEHVGRNYKREKDFKTIMQEFSDEAGTRYNPDLISLINAHKNVARNLKMLVDDGWLNIYYNIHSQFFR